ncbi:MAG TPA: NTP transferase domain-containing protein [Egibacteraceae bacterium]|nr:NTP transferase domain-containing protein [Egibacteraceae bacterium]
MSNAPQVVVLAAGLGSRLAKPFPKPLTPLHGTGTSIMQQQMDHLSTVFPDCWVCVVVGFKKDLIMEAFPDVLYVYNEDYSDTNTSKSLLKALRGTRDGGVIWLNGDVVFEQGVLELLRPHVEADESVVCVDHAAVGEEEVKYTVDDDGYIAELSKQVTGALGEAVGINYVSSADKPALIRRLAECDDNDYFERGIELAIQHDGVRFRPVDISKYAAVEVDFAADLDRANRIF